MNNRTTRPEPRKDILQLIADGNEQKAATLISLTGNWGHESQKMLCAHAEYFTDPDTLFNLILDVYVNDGYDFPKKMILLAKRLAKQISPERRLKGLIDGDPVTVYRGAWINTLDCATLRTDISWTTDKNTAIWFANRMRGGKLYGYIPMNPAVYEATIDRNKIIAYTNDRGEFEVLQHMGIKDTHVLNIPEEEWQAGVAAVVADHKKHWEQLSTGVKK